MSPDEKVISWQVFDGTEIGPWRFIAEIESSDPEQAARRACARKWRSGSHTMLVVGVSEAHEFKITLDVINMKDEK